MLIHYFTAYPGDFSLGHRLRQVFQCNDLIFQKY